MKNAVVTVPAVSSFYADLYFLTGIDQGLVTHYRGVGEQLHVFNTYTKVTKFQISSTVCLRASLYL